MSVDTSRPMRRRRRLLYGVLGLAVASFLILSPSPIEEQFWALLAPVKLIRPVTAARSFEPPRRVFLITFDGLSIPLFEAAAPPTLVDLSRDGRVATSAKTVADSTLESHAALVAGLPPDKNGLDTHTYRPWSRFRTTTLFGLCARSGLRCGLIAEKEKLAAIAVNEPGVTHFECVHGSRAVLDAALAYVRTDDPDFVMIHLGDTDGVGHRAGWASAEQRAVLLRMDQELAGFLVQASSARARPLSILITADHGGWNKRHWSGEPWVDRVPWILWGDGVVPGKLPAEISVLDTAPTLAALLGLAAPAEWEGTSRVETPGVGAVLDGGQVPPNDGPSANPG